MTDSTLPDVKRLRTPVDMNPGGMSPSAREYLRLREKGGRLPSRRDLQQQLMECEEALTATEHALAEASVAVNRLPLYEELREAVEFHFDRAAIPVGVESVSEKAMLAVLSKLGRGIEPMTVGGTDD